MKMFLAENLSVEDRAVKFAASASSATSLEGALYHDWAEAQSIWQIVDGIICQVLLIGLFKVLVVNRRSI